MGRASASLCVFGLAGCAQIFGIDNTSAPADVALPPRATLRVDRVAFGATVEVTPEPTLANVAYLIPDDTDTSGMRRIAATQDGDVWSAELPEGVAASVEYSLVGNRVERRLATFPYRDLHFQSGVYEVAGQQVAPMAAKLQMTLTLPNGFATGQSLALYAIGPWRYHGVSEGLPAVDIGATQVGPAEVQYTTTSFSSPIGERALYGLSPADRLVALRYVGNDLTAAGEVAPFTQTGDDTIMATLAEVPHTNLDVSLDPSAYAGRLGMPSPKNGTAVVNWSVTAAPGWYYANPTGVQLNAGSLAPTTGMTTVTSGFGNPFTALAWRTMFNIGAGSNRTYTPPALALPGVLYNGINHHMLEPGAAAIADVQVGLPVLVLVNEVPLTSDGLTVTIDPNKAVKLDAITDKSGDTLYQHVIHEARPNNMMPATAIDWTPVYVATGPTTDMTLPAGVFVTGKVYMIRVHCYRGGFPTASSGDHTNRDLPLSVGYTDSGVFTVAAP